jgi:hypothetical protein
VDSSIIAACTDGDAPGILQFVRDVLTRGQCLKLNIHDGRIIAVSFKLTLLSAQCLVGVLVGDLVGSPG